jgi:hypothetical protein
MSRRLHPEGVAALIAVIVAAEDVRIEAEKSVQAPTVDQRRLAYKQAVLVRLDQVLRLARKFYRDHPIDFEDPGNWRARKTYNSLQNLAKLDRANLLNV